VPLRHSLTLPLPVRHAAAKLSLVLCAALAASGCATSPSLPRLETASLERAVRENALAMQVPGAVVLLRTPQGDFKVAWGTTTWKGSVPVDPKLHVRVGSNTKTWVGTVILQMVQEGKLRLEDPVSRYRPEVPNGANITIEQLLTMRSGVFNYTETVELNEIMDAEPKRVWRPTDLVAMGIKRPPYFAPGTGFHYSNTNTVLLGLIAEQIDGKPLPAILRDRLFVPLGMKNTHLPDSGENVLPEPRSRGYMFGNNALTVSTPALPEPMQAQARAGTLLPVDQTDVNPSWGWAAGAGISTAEDLMTWVRALADGGVLGAPMQKRRMESVQPINPAQAGGAQYGMAIAKFGPLYGHTGELPGFNSFMGHDPVNGVTLVVWTNLAPAADGTDPAVAIAKALMAQIYGHGL
jgi:D-alanyl-D-alanine carboxypeptidase